MSDNNNPNDEERLVESEKTIIINSAKVLNRNIDNYFVESLAHTSVKLQKAREYINTLINKRERLIEKNQRLRDTLQWIADNDKGEIGQQAAAALSEESHEP